MIDVERIPRHVTIAAESGMKAGYKVFESASSKSGLKPVQRVWADYKPLNSKSRFNLYCATFGPMAESLGAPKAAATRAPVVEERKDDDVQRLVEAAQELLAQAQRITDERAGVELVAAKPKAKKQTSKPKNETSLFNKGVVAALGIPTKVGASFTYKGKHGKSKWTVVSSKGGSITAARA